VRRQAAAERGAGRVPGLDLAQCAERRGEAVLQEGVGLAGAETVQDAKQGVWHHGPDLDRLGQMGGEEMAAAGGMEAGRDLKRAEAVAVGLEHAGGIPPGTVTIPQGAPIRRQGAEVHVQHRAAGGEGFNDGNRPPLLR
jgi:hypothetical protein